MILDIIYNLFVTPIQMIIEFIFSIIYRICDNPGISIIGVSLAVNFLVLPLYKRSDALQDEEREKQAEMKPWLEHIKKNFKGDERYMMTQTYYRQVGYKPIYALRSSISLLLQIPFFIAAYQYLSHLGLLQDASFLCFSNLGAPDQLIPFFGGIKLNLLPILMTSINIISGAVYTRGYPLKDKLQLYIVALLFLVLLYGSPSGLVFYWTLNNLFSLGKNIVMKALPKREKKTKAEPKLIEKKFYVLGVLALTILCGAVIPLSVLSISPQEFISSNYGPMWLMIYALSVYAGLFVIWLSIFYYLGNNRAKNAIVYIVWILFGIGIANHFFFGKDYGNMSSNLLFDESVSIHQSSILLNLAVLIAVSLFCYFLMKKFPKVVKAILSIAVISGIGYSAYLGYTTQASAAKVLDKRTVISSADEAQPIYNLSKDGKNTIVIVLDRAIGGYIPQILEEKPELIEKLDGFTYYSHTLSFSHNTNMSTPSLYGGYDYLPAYVNEDTDKTLKDKHNEAESVLPKLFSDEGYNVQLYDIAYLGDYEWTPDMHYFDDKYENVTGYDTAGVYNILLDNEYVNESQEQQQKNFVYYSVFRCSPVALHSLVYNDGQYLSTTKPVTINESFINRYSALATLSQLTQVSDSGDNMLMMHNETTHHPTILNDDYEIDPDYEYEGDDAEHRANYCVNMVSILRLCDWFDYLREQGVYDNTRIIICSDHGAAFGDFDYMINDYTDLEAFDMLYMVKDYNATGFTTSDEVVTAADVPADALEGNIENPVNPFTGNAISRDRKNSEDLVITNSYNWSIENDNPANVFNTSDTGWLRYLGGDLYSSKSWEKASDVPVYDKDGKLVTD